MECTAHDTNDNAAIPIGEVDHLDCGCSDVYYTDGTVCYEHNHIECDGTA
jgi:hypothetical protein